LTATKQDIDAALARLAEAFPQTFVLEKYRPHWPLKVGIASAIPARCPALEWRVLKMALTAYTGRLMYLRGLVEGAARVDLDGNPAGEVSAMDADHAAGRLASLEAGRIAATEAARAGRQAAKAPAPIPPKAASPPVPLKGKLVLRLPAFRRAAQ
jgi:ProP effector